MSDTINVGLLGHGVVGGGVARTLRDKAETIARRVGRRVAVKGVLVRDTSRHRDAEWLRITDNGTNTIYQYSFDGVNFLTQLSETRGTFGNKRDGGTQSTSLT